MKNYAQIKRELKRKTKKAGLSPFQLKPLENGWTLKETQCLWLDLAKMSKIYKEESDRSLLKQTKRLQKVTLACSYFDSVMTGGVAVIFSPENPLATIKFVKTFDMTGRFENEHSEEYILKQTQILAKQLGVEKEYKEIFDSAHTSFSFKKPMGAQLFENLQREIFEEATELKIDLVTRINTLIREAENQTTNESMEQNV